MALVRGNEIPTIDVALVTVKTKDAATEIGLKTASKIAVEPQVTTQEPSQLIVKGVLLAQKGEQRTLTGNQITLTDNVLNPQLLKIWQGGTLVMDTVDTSKVVSYTPPANGEKGEVFELSAYSAIYNTAAVITGYEKITYPNCQGSPFAPSSEDGVFRAAELIANSAPEKGQAPYKIEYVKTLPAIS